MSSSFQDKLSRRRLFKYGMAGLTGILPDLAPPLFLSSR